MDSSARIDEISGRILEVYGSLQEPKYHFVERALKSRPYEELMVEIAGTFETKENSDPNEDVSFVYYLWSRGMQWCLQLSMVGPYAVLLGGPPGETHVLGESDLTEPEELALIACLHKHGIHLLGCDVLETPCALKQWYTEPENVRLYQALFTDVEQLPWEFKSTRDA